MCVRVCVCKYEHAPSHRIHTLTHKHTHTPAAVAAAAVAAGQAAAAVAAAAAAAEACGLVGELGVWRCVAAQPGQGKGKTRESGRGGWTERAKEVRCSVPGEGRTLSEKGKSKRKWEGRLNKCARRSVLQCTW